MQLTPRYGADPILTLDGSPSEILEPFTRQRRRLAAALAGFTDQQWAHPSRCEGWSNRDVVAHLESVNTFWAFSVVQGVQGEPTQLLASFDPVATPAQLVDGVSDLSAGQVYERFLASNDGLLDVLASLDDAGWTALAEAPPGHISVSALAHHGLWDGWVHERDVLLPLAISPDEEADEIVSSLRYVAGLGPALGRNNGATGTGTYAIETTEPDVSIVVDIGENGVAVSTGPADPETELRLTGRAVDLLETLSLRQPFDQPVPPASAWMLHGLVEAFHADQP